MLSVQDVTPFEQVHVLHPSMSGYCCPDAYVTLLYKQAEQREERNRHADKGETETKNTYIIKTYTELDCCRGKH